MVRHCCSLPQIQVPGRALELQAQSLARIFCAGAVQPTNRLPGTCLTAELPAGMSASQEGH